MGLLQSWSRLAGYRLDGISQEREGGWGSRGWWAIQRALLMYIAFLQLIIPILRRQ